MRSGPLPPGDAKHDRLARRAVRPAAARLEGREADRTALRCHPRESAAAPRRRGGITVPAPLPPTPDSPTVALGTDFEGSAGFLRGSMTIFATRMLCLGVGFFQAALTARILHPEGKGLLAAALVVPQLFAMLAPLGINFACTYHLGRKTFDREALIRSVLTALLLLGAAGMLGSLIAGHFLKSTVLQGVSGASFVLATLTIPTQIGMLFLLALYRGEMRIGEANLFELVRASAMFVLIMLFLVAFSMGVTGVILAQFVAEIGVTLWAIRRFGGITAPMIRWSVLRTLLGYGLQVYSFSILLYLNYRMDLFLVRSWLDLTQTGLYAAVATLAEVMWVIPNSLGTLLFPSIASTSGRSRDLLTLAVCRRSLYLMLILCGILAISRNLVIRILFGSAFLAAAPALLALLPGILSMSAQNVVGSDLMGRGRPLPVTLGAGLGLVANLVLNILWIPRYGIVGASLASSVSYTLVTVVVLAAFVRLTRSKLRDALVLRREDLRALSRLVLRSGEAAA
jgi:O-antigen/teichoic acid export membrane protein